MHPLFPWKIGRGSFALRNIVMNLCLWPLVPLVELGPTGDGLANPAPAWALALVLVGYWIFGVGLPRCRDAGFRWWILFLLAVPLVNSVVACLLLATGWRPPRTIVQTNLRATEERAVV
jgi:hypothetical protein